MLKYGDLHGFHFQTGIPATVLFILDIGPTETHSLLLNDQSRINKKHTPGSPAAVFNHQEPSHESTSRCFSSRRLYNYFQKLVV